MEADYSYKNSTTYTKESDSRATYYLEHLC